MLTTSNLASRSPLVSALGLSQTLCVLHRSSFQRSFTLVESLPCQFPALKFPIAKSGLASAVVLQFFGILLKLLAAFSYQVDECSKVLGASLYWWVSERLK